MPRTAPTISFANRIDDAGITFVSRSIPSWWYTQVSNETLASRSSGSGPPIACASPRNLPQWYGTAPPPCGMTSCSSGKSANRSPCSNCMKAVVSALR